LRFFEEALDLAARDEGALDSAPGLSAIVESESRPAAARVVRRRGRLEAVLDSVDERDAPSSSVISSSSGTEPKLSRRSLDSSCDLRFPFRDDGRDFWLKPVSLLHRRCRDFLL
jgi:hypothetical protein